MKKNNSHLLSIHLRATNTVVGNPCRLFLVIDKSTGNAIDAVDEGYRGRAAVTDRYPGITEGPQISVPNSEYRATLSQFAYKAVKTSTRGLLQVEQGTGRVVYTGPSATAKRIADGLNAGKPLADLVGEPAAQ